MKLLLHTPAKSLNKAYLKQSLKREQIETLRTNLITMFERLNPGESEEHLKNIVADFLKDTWYKPAFEINTSGRADLVVHNGRSSKDPVGIIIEVKRPDNATEMISPERPNSKALHELLLYKLLSPPHLLKLSFANDSNALNKEFYNELLYILGLEEVKEKGKKLIRRKPQGKRDEGSLLENTVNILKIRQKPAYVANPEQYGATEEEQLFSIGLVDQILTARKADPQADTTDLERQIDALVYELYDLTDEEIAIVEGMGK